MAGCRDGTLSGDCVGGVVVNGVCEGKCTPDKCAYEDNTCVANRCVLACDAHADCLLDGTQVCGPAKEDDTNADITICQDSGRAAGLGVPCPAGDECGAGLACETKGEADATAYCTTRDCASDADCLPGYYCGVIHDPHEVCGSNPKKGNDTFCGEIMEACKSPGDGGTSLFEGSLCMLRTSCLKRAQAAPCASDLDCSWIEGQVCREAGGQMGCTRACQFDEDCPADTKCELPGDTEAGAFGACMPRFGAWVGSPEAFCEPCLNDEDCGKKGSSWGCAELANGMRGCFDGAYSTPCVTDQDCPVAPSGKPGSCLDDRFKVDPSDPRYQKCYLPLDPDLLLASCW